MAGYTVFIAPIIGIMVADYWYALFYIGFKFNLTDFNLVLRILHNQKVDVPSMYRPYARYWYTYGISTHFIVLLLGCYPCGFNIDWRALAAMLLTVPPMLPGLASAITPSINVGRAYHLYVSLLFPQFENQIILSRPRNSVFFLDASAG
jgi:nucleobase:cation symporter-1, NCS1 family